jgi:hypothetical protein
MAGETYIICKGIDEADIPDDIDFQVCDGEYHFKFYSDLWEMRNFLEVCKVSNDINDIYLSCAKPLIELVHRLQIKDYVIQYENDFAGIPDDNGFTIPVSNGVILNRLIIDEDEKGIWL